MSTAGIDVEIEDDAWTAELADVHAIVERAALAALAGPDAPPGGSIHDADALDAGIAIILTSDEAVRALNARFRGKDAPTNVLSFPAPESAWPHLGDIALASGVCRREAKAQNTSLAHHAMHLTVHGVLHLLGYDHLTDAEAEVMEGLERVILAGLGIADPYALPHARGFEANG